MSQVETSNGNEHFSNGVNKLAGGSLLDFDEASGLFQHSNGTYDHTNGHGSNGNGISFDDPFASDPFSAPNELDSPFHRASNPKSEWLSASPLMQEDDIDTVEHDPSQVEKEQASEQLAPAVSPDAARPADNDFEHDQQPDINVEHTNITEEASNKWDSVPAVLSTDEPNIAGQQDIKQEELPSDIPISASANETASPVTDDLPVAAAEPLAPSVTDDIVPVTASADPNASSVTDDIVPVTASAKPIASSVINEHEPEPEPAAQPTKLDEATVVDTKPDNDDLQKQDEANKKPATEDAKRDSTSSANPRKSSAQENRARRVAATSSTASRFGLTSDSVCCVCGKRVYTLEAMIAAGRLHHKSCARCAKCNRNLDASTYNVLESKLYCKPHLDEAVRASAVTSHYIRSLASKSTTTAAARSSSRNRSSLGVKRLPDDGKQAENVVNANTNADVLASELESVRKADVLKSARSRFAEAASAATPETVTLRPKSTREIHYATRMSYNGPPRRAVSMHNLATEFSLANEESKPDVVLSSESYVADELELLRSRAVARQSIGKFAEPVEDSFTSSVTSRPADIECPVGTVKKLAKSSFAINELGLDDGRDKPTQNFTDDLPSNGLARKMAARFQIADENPEAEGEPDSAAV